MAHKAQFVTGWFLPVDTSAHPEHPIAPGGPETPVDPDYGIPGPPYPHPEHPIVIPPLVGIWPPPGRPAHPIVIPPQPPDAQGPIYIEGTPEKPITSAPGTLQPAVPAGTLPMGKVAVLVEVVGVPGKRWLTVDNTPTVNPLPGGPQHR